MIWLVIHWHGTNSEWEHWGAQAPYAWLSKISVSFVCLNLPVLQNRKLLRDESLAMDLYRLKQNETMYGDTAHARVRPISTKNWNLAQLQLDVDTETAFPYYYQWLPLLVFHLIGHWLYYHDRTSMPILLECTTASLFVYFSYRLSKGLFSVCFCLRPLTRRDFWWKLDIEAFIKADSRSIFVIHPLTGFHALCKVLLAWNQSTLVLSFRGTVNISNILNDLSVSLLKMCVLVNFWALHNVPILETDFS